MSGQYQQVYASPVLLAQLYAELPSSKIQRKHQGLKEGDDLTFQYDAQTYHIKVGERKIFPEEVARMIVKQSTYRLAELAADPLSFCELIDEPNQGAINPLACPAPGCKYQAKDMVGLGKHIIAKHQPEKEFQNAAIPQGVHVGAPNATTDGPSERT
jgi:hypothetical protein